MRQRWCEDAVLYGAFLWPYGLVRVRMVFPSGSSSESVSGGADLSEG